MSGLIIVGSGLAGYTLAREFRKLDKETAVTLISRDAADSYSKPMLSTALAQGKDARTLVMTPMAKMAEQLGLNIISHTSVKQIDTQAKQCYLSDGKTVDYERLVLALGADPIRIPFEGDANDEVLSINDIDDYARFRARLTDKVKRVAIVGAGLIGCEFASDLLSQGYQVDVIGLGGTPLDTLIPAAAGRALQTALEQAGVNWHLGTTVETLYKNDTGYHLTLENSTELECDLVLSAIGLRPRTELAAAAGLQTQRGIVVNDMLQSSDVSIYALGDCAEVDGQVLPYIMPIMQGARALAKTLAGEPTKVVYPVMPVVIKTTRHPVVVAGIMSGEGVELTCEQIADGLKLIATNAQGSITGFCLTGAEANKEKQNLVAQMK